MARRKLIAGNWKMNKTPTEGAAFAREMGGKLKPYTDKTDVAFCVPFVDISAVLTELSGSGVAVGAQDVSAAESGEYTGETSAVMLKDAGVVYAVIGHSERRKYFGESEQLINGKAKAAIGRGLTPIICVGELAEERRDGVTGKVLETQVKGAFDGISKGDAAKTVIAYEPVWAIGKNALRAATDDEAQEACALIRGILAALYGKETAEVIRVLYGGSVRPANAENLFALPGVDGGLVGGASLTADFEAIVKAAG